MIKLNLEFDYVTNEEIGGYIYDSEVSIHAPRGGSDEIAGTFLLFPAGTVKPWAEFCEENGLDFGD